MKMMLVVSMIMMVGCGPDNTHSKYWEDKWKEEAMRMQICRDSGGMVRPGVYGGRTNHEIYGGCDFPPVVKQDGK